MNYESYVPQEEPQTKKYKCVLKPTGTSSTSFAFISLLETKSNSHDVLQLLLRMSEAPNFHVRFSHILLKLTVVLSSYVMWFVFQEDGIPDAIKKLSDHFREEKESAVRVIILSIFADMGSLIEINFQVNCFSFLFLYLKIYSLFNSTYILFCSLYKWLSMKLFYYWRTKLLTKCWIKDCLLCYG